MLSFFWILFFFGWMCGSCSVWLKESELRLHSGSKCKYPFHSYDACYCWFYSDCLAALAGDSSRNSLWILVQLLFKTGLGLLVFHGRKWCDGPHAVLVDEWCFPLVSSDERLWFSHTSRILVFPLVHSWFLMGFHHSPSFLHLMVWSLVVGTTASQMVGGHGRGNASIIGSKIKSVRHRMIATAYHAGPVHQILGLPSMVEILKLKQLELKIRIVKETWKRILVCTYYLKIWNLWNVPRAFHASHPRPRLSLYGRVVCQLNLHPQHHGPGGSPCRPGRREKLGGGTTQ